MGAGAAMMATLDESQIDGLDAGQVDSVVSALREENVSLKKFIASEDAEAVFKATDGLGTDEMRLVEVLCKRTKVCNNEPFALQDQRFVFYCYVK
jgi:Annexin